MLTSKGDSYSQTKTGVYLGSQELFFQLYLRVIDIVIMEYICILKYIT